MRCVREYELNGDGKTKIDMPEDSLVLSAVGDDSSDNVSLHVLVNEYPDSLEETRTFVSYASGAKIKRKLYLLEYVDTFKTEFSEGHVFEVV